MQAIPQFSKQIRSVLATLLEKVLPSQKNYLALRRDSSQMRRIRTIVMIRKRYIVTRIPTITTRTSLDYFNVCIQESTPIPVLCKNQCYLSLSTTTKQCYYNLIMIVVFLIILQSCYVI